MVRSTLAAMGALALAGAVTAPAEAGTIVYTAGTVGGGPGTAPKFDPALGTLTRVTFDNTYSFSVFLNNFDPFGAAPQVRVDGSLGWANYGSATVSGVYQSDRVNPGVVFLGLSGTSHTVLTGDLGEFVGPGPLFLGVSLAATFSLLDGTPLTRTYPTFPGQVNGTYRITYDYADAVPEPSTWALMLLGFGMAGYALRRQRPAARRAAA